MKIVQLVNFLMRTNKRRNFDQRNETYILRIAHKSYLPLIAERKKRLKYSLVKSISNGISRNSSLTLSISISNIVVVFFYVPFRQFIPAYFITFHVCVCVLFSLSLLLKRWHFAKLTAQYVNKLYIVAEC